VLRIPLVARDARVQLGHELLAELDADPVDPPLMRGFAGSVGAGDSVSQD